MDKEVIFAVAGSGKTSEIVNRLDLERRILVITYTENNFLTLRRRIAAKFGYMPENISLQTYFSFLNGFCYRPFLSMALKSRGITFRTPPVYTSRLPLTNDKRFFDTERRVYHGRMAKLLEVKNCMTDLGRRVERYFDTICVDEVQDFAGHDFNLLMNLCHLRTNVLLVGDFHQYTYSTSQDGAVNKNLHEDYEQYKARFRGAGLRVDTSSLVKTHRCSPAVCSFIRKELGIEIYSCSEEGGEVAVVTAAADATRLHICQSTVKLFYEEHWRYGCYSENWGGSKGIDHYLDVCVVMNPKSWKDFQAGGLTKAKPRTKNKLYVACSRARGKLYLAPDKLFCSVRSQ